MTAIHVVRGRAEAEELAALAVVLLALGRRATPAPGAASDETVSWPREFGGYRSPTSWAGLPREASRS
ncbi:acyl-CoA carboxylase epsilon subunit [Streptosporangium saharense]|uniref:acyl-CoA carboxylase epsilon subunit n=1 Tax=Streptosporangium saharense TaxID=1706840 RepID=UPI0036A2FEF5